MPEQAPPISSDVPPVSVGAVLGGRFEITGGLGEDHLAHVWTARDQRSRKRISIRVLRDGALPAAALALLRQECQIAAKLKHRNIARVLGLGKTPAGGTFVAQEWVKGTPLTTFVTSREASGEPLSLRGTYNVVAHVCNALSYAHTETCHGALRPEIVWVTKGGRVKVADFAVSKAAIHGVGVQAFGEAARACLSPELKAGQKPTARSDVFGIGAILYQLLTGLSPADTFVAPSKAHPDATAGIDEILLKCLSRDPGDRYASPQEIRAALLPLLTEANSLPPTKDFAIAEEVDLRSVLPPAGLDVPGVSLGPKKKGLSGDLTKLLERLSDDSRAKWMVTRDAIDHGPFTARELVERIANGEFGPKDHALNIEDRQRQRLEEWTTFKPFLRQREREEAAVVQEEKRARVEVVERRSSLMKWVVSFAIFGAIALVAAAFFATREQSAQRADWDAEFEELYKLGKIKLGEVGLLPDTAPAPSRKRANRGQSRSSRDSLATGSGRASRPSGGGFTSYEAAMNRAVELGDVTQGGSETRLSGEKVASILNGQLNRLYRECVIPEVKSGGRLGNVTMDVAIAGNGSVLGATVRAGSGTFRACLARAVRSIRFPKFGAPRMGARYSFSVE